MCTNNNDNVQFDLSVDFGDSNYKSCFARSVAVNSQFHSKSLEFRHKLGNNNKEENGCSSGYNEVAIAAEIMRLRKVEENRRLSCCSGSSGSGNDSRRGSDLPVENLALQSQVDALQWQLKQAENSREMYRAVMQQVVCFLERAHRSLDQLCEKNGVSRSRSEYHVDGSATPPSIHENCPSLKDFTWRKSKRQQTSPNEIPPDKLSQEAFRLLRTAQSLLNTREPDLAHLSADLPNKDQDFLNQLAKEFPSRPPQRAISFSLNPQLINPSDREIRISTAFNRKLSLQRTPSLRQEPVKKDMENDYCILNVNDNSKRGSISSMSCMKKNCISNEKTTTGSVSSAEDESGFSSMNSFQEVGLPLITSSLMDDDSNGNMGDISVNSSDSNITQINVTSDSVKSLEKAKLIWNRSECILPIAHRRWSSTPVEVAQNDPLKVLWV